jgi:hypothetical protein
MCFPSCIFVFSVHLSNFATSIIYKRKEQWIKRDRRIGNETNDAFHAHMAGTGGFMSIEQAKRVLSVSVNSSLLFFDETPHLIQNALLTSQDNQNHSRMRNLSRRANNNLPALHPGHVLHPYSTLDPCFSLEPRAWLRSEENVQTITLNALVLFLQQCGP